MFLLRILVRKGSLCADQPGATALSAAKCQAWPMLPAEGPGPRGALPRAEPCGTRTGREGLIHPDACMPRRGRLQVGVGGRWGPGCVHGASIIDSREHTETILKSWLNRAGGGGVSMSKRINNHGNDLPLPPQAPRSSISLFGTCLEVEGR